MPKLPKPCRWNILSRNPKPDKPERPQSPKASAKKAKRSFRFIG